MQLFHLFADSSMRKWRILRYDRGYLAFRLHLIYTLFLFYGFSASFCNPLNVGVVKIIRNSFKPICTEENSRRQS